MNEKVIKATRERKKRIPIGSRSRLAVEGKDEKNFMYRLVNDQNDRLAMFQDAGYEFVPIEEASVAAQRLAQGTEPGTNVSVDVGGGKKAYLMKIPKEFYEEDQRAKEASILAVEQTITNPKIADSYGKVSIS